MKLLPFENVTSSKAWGYTLKAISNIAKQMGIYKSRARL